MKLDHGGHLTHGMKINFSGRLYDIVAYGVREEDSRIDMDELARARRGAQAQADPGRLVGLPAPARLRRASARSPTRWARCSWSTWRTSPGWWPRASTPRRCRYADVVTTTIHKTLGGARGGMILCTRGVGEEDQLRRLPRPAGRAADARHRRQGGGAEDRRRPSSSASASGAPARARARLAEELVGAGVNVLTGGTDVHLVLVDLRDSELDGQQAEDRLHEIGITVNRNAVPFDPRPPAVSSGLRVGTPALATRGLRRRRLPRGRADHRRGAHAATGPTRCAAELTERNRALAERYPLYPQLAAPRPAPERAALPARGRRGPGAAAGPSCRAST